MSLFGGGKSKVSSSSQIGSLRIQSQGYGNVIPLIYGTTRVPVTLFFYTGFMAMPQKDKSQSGGKGGMMGGSKGNSTFSYSATVLMGIANHRIATGKLWVDKQVYATAGAAGFFTKDGQTDQEPFVIVSALEPAKAVCLRHFGYLAAWMYPLSDGGTLGNHSVEAIGMCSHVPDGVPDANPADIIGDLLMRCGLTPSSLATYKTVMANNDYLFSLALTEQKAVGEIIADLLNMTSAELVVRNQVIDVVPYYQDGLHTGYLLSNDDFIAEQGQGSIKPTRKKAIDCFNSLKIECLDRHNDYNIVTVEAKDAGSIAAIGARPAETLTAHYITEPQRAIRLANFILQRDLVLRNSYEFTVSLRYLFLEPMDIVDIVDERLGLNNAPVIIRKIVITPDYQLRITADDYAAELATQPDYPLPVIEPFIPVYNAAVANINPPVIFQAPAALTSTGYEVWCAVSNNDALYGGCDIYLSVDEGVSYNKIGSHIGESRMGVLTADLAAGSSPDTVHTLSVDLTESSAELATVSQVAVDTYDTLSRVGKEFLAYRYATLSGASLYDIGYLHRGLYGSTQGAVTGDHFVRCDDALFRFPFNPVYLNSRFKLKFAAFNIYGGAVQDIATLPAYDFSLLQVTFDSTRVSFDSRLHTLDAN